MTYQTSIKVPEELRKKLRAQAEEEERTVSNMIVYILKQYYKDKAE